MPLSRQALKPYSLGNDMTFLLDGVFVSSCRKAFHVLQKSKGYFYCYDFIMLLYGVICCCAMKAVRGNQPQTGHIKVGLSGLKSPFISWEGKECVCMSNYWRGEVHLSKLIFLNQAKRSHTRGDPPKLELSSGGRAPCRTGLPS